MFIYVWYTFQKFTILANGGSDIFCSASDILECSWAWIVSQSSFHFRARPRGSQPPVHDSKPLKNLLNKTVDRRRWTKVDWSSDCFLAKYPTATTTTMADEGNFVDLFLELERAWKPGPNFRLKFHWSLTIDWEPRPKTEKAWKFFGCKSQ